MTKDLFAYGTLMCEDIMLAVAGCPLKGVRGLLRDYQRKTIRDEVYPGIVPRTGESVEGVVFRDVPDAAWRRLDTFEGEMYYRAVVCAELEDGSAREVQTYVVRPEFEYRVGTSPWSLEEFLESDRGLFESRYRGFDALREGSRNKSEPDDPSQ